MAGQHALLEELSAQLPSTRSAGANPTPSAKAAVLATPPQIHQILLPGLQRVDRCTTCHLGVDDPTMKNAPGALPLSRRTRARTFLPSSAARSAMAVKVWPPTSKDAHGNVPFWPDPLLPADYIRASCGRCHKEGDVPGVPELTEGRRLFETQGCRGCHKLNGVGGSIGPDLTEEGANHRSPRMARTPFPGAQSRSPPAPRCPTSISRNEQARALTYYMLSLTNEEMGSYYSSVRLIPSPDYGRAIVCRKELHRLPCRRRSWRKDGPRSAGRHQAPLARMARRATGQSAACLSGQLHAGIRPGDQCPQGAGRLSWHPPRRRMLQAILSHRGNVLTPEDAAIEAGKQDFARFGCAGCHGTELQGGVPNPNAQGGEVPSLLHVSDDYTKDEVIEIIRNGKMPPLDNRRRPHAAALYALLEKADERRRHPPDRRLPLVEAREVKGELVADSWRNRGGSSPAPFAPFDDY